MASQEARAPQLRQFVEALNAADWPRVRELLTDEFFDYHPFPDEQQAPEAFAALGADLRGGAPDLVVSVDELQPDGEYLRGTMTASGSFVGHLWGLQGTGREVHVEATVVARFEGAKLALRWERVNFLGTLREIGVVPLPENAHKWHDPPVALPEIIYRLAFNRLRLAEKPCTHLDQIAVTEPSTTVCAQCEATGTEYPAIRMCLVCGFVGCCDASTNKHMMKHCEATGHPIVRSAQPGESWLWCYPDQAFLSSRHLKRSPETN